MGNNYFSIVELDYKFCFDEINEKNQSIKNGVVRMKTISMVNKCWDLFGDDTSLESLLGFFLFKPLVSEPPAQRYVTKASLDKSKSNMHVPKNYQWKRKQIISVQQNSPSFPTSSATSLIQNYIVQPFISKVLDPTPVTKFAPPQGWATQFQFMKAPKKEITSSTREDCSSRKFHEKYYYDFKAFVASPLTQFSMELRC